MRHLAFAIALGASIAWTGMTGNAAGASAGSTSVVRAIDLRAADGTLLKASYFPSSRPGPGVLLFHQGNRDRRAWDDLARRLAAGGINTLTIDMRGFGESGGPAHDMLTSAQRADAREHLWPGDIDAAWRFLVSQPGVRAGAIGLGGAGWDGVDNAVLAARRHSGAVKSLVLLSGETFLPGLRFLHQASGVPGLFLADDSDEYPPTVEAMQLLYSMASSRAKRFIHYAGPEAPWTGFEDRPGVAATGGHGTDMFRTHPELSGAILRWFEATLLPRRGRPSFAPGRSPALPFQSIVDRLETPDGIAYCTRLLAMARRRNPAAQLWPEIILGILGTDHVRAGEPRAAIDILRLNLAAYPQSADANDNLANAYMAAGERGLARIYSERALAILASPSARASSWAATPQFRDLVRGSAERRLRQLDQN